MSAPTLTKETQPPERSLPLASDGTQPRPMGPSDCSNTPAVRVLKQPLCAALPLLLGVWGVGILFLFTDRLPPELRPALHSLSTLGLALLSSYSFWFLGWRLRRRLLPRLGDDIGGLDVSLLEIALGIGCVVAATFLVGMFGLYHRAAAWAIVGLPLVGNHQRFLAELLGRVEPLRHPRIPRSGGFVTLAKLLILAVFVMTLVNSLTPATSQDALVYHLAVPAKYIARGEIHFVEGNFFSAFPQNVDMLFTLGLLLEGDILAKWYHWMLGGLAVFSVAALARRVSPPQFSSPSSWLAASLFATIPSVALLAGWAYIDLGVVFFATMSTILFLHFWHWRRTEDTESTPAGSRTCLLLAAALAGLAAGCKYTAGTQGLILAGTVLALGLLRRRPLRLVAMEAGVVCTVVVVCLAPWLLKNVISTGNPLYPFAFSFFGGVGWDAERASVLSESLAEWGGGRSAWQLLALPWDVSLSGRFFSQANFDGIIGCAFLIGAPILVYGMRLGDRFRITTAFLVLHGLAWIALTHQVRFLLPGLALVSALTAVSVCSLGGVWNRRLVLVLLSAAMVSNVSVIAKHFASHNALPFVLGLESRDRFLDREVAGGDYRVFRYIEEHLPTSSRVLFGSCGNPGFLCKRPYHSDALFENHTLARFLREVNGPAELYESLAEAGFTHILFRFENVFDPSGQRSEIPLEHQQLLASFLNRHGDIVYTVAGTFLYKIHQSDGRSETE